MRAEKFDVLASHRDIKTTVELGNDGHIFQVIRLSNGEKFGGLYAGSMASFYDAQGDLLGRSGPYIHGLDGPLPGQDTRVRTVQHEGDLGADKVGRVNRIVIVHSLESKDIPFPDPSKIAEYVLKAVGTVG